MLFSTTFTTTYTGRYFLKDFSEASFTGTVTVKKVLNGKTTVAATLKVENGKINDPKKNDFLLEGNTEYIIECSVKTGLFKESTLAHVTAQTLFYRANMYQDDSFNSLANAPLNNQPRVNVSPDQEGNVQTLVSDDFNFYEYVGYGDLKDWRQINISADGSYTISVSKNLKDSTPDKNILKSTLYQVNGTSLKAIASMTLGNGKEEGNIISDKLLAAGTYYLLQEAPDGSKGYATVYGTSISGTAFSQAADGSQSPLTTPLVMDSDRFSGELNFASQQINCSWQVENAGLYQLTLFPMLKESSGNNAMTLTLYKAEDGKTALSKVISISTKNIKDFQEFNSKEIFLDQGKYFISISSSQAAKGAEVTFVTEYDCTCAYPITVSSCTNFLNAGTVSVSEKTNTLAEKLYAGFDSPSDWMRLNLSGDAASAALP